MRQGPIAQLVPLRDGVIRFVEALFSPSESTHWFAVLRDGTSWRQEEIRIFGKRRPSPRLTAWHGDAGAQYSYSGLTLDPAPWTEALLAIKRRVEAVSGAGFNSVLMNYYRHGQDSMGWHSDDEPELGEAPLIGAVSFGASRRLQLRHRSVAGLRKTIDLPGGSYLEMAGPMQRHWRHCIPKETAATGAGPRISLTFRTIKKPGAAIGARS